MNRDGISPDAVSYIRIAQYYVGDQIDLAISGYWGPMLSWLIVPWLSVFQDPLIAAHAAMVVSAVVFLFGSYCVLRVFRPSDAAILIGTWMSAVVGVSWSVTAVTPDLLMAGVLCIGISCLVLKKWSTNAWFGIGTGLILGASYLAKAPALPISILMIVGAVSHHIVIYRIGFRQAIRVAVVTFAGFLIIAGPWIGILSNKYGGLVFSTSAVINHAIVGPKDMDRFHPGFRTFHRPEPGRVTSWEDPTGLPYKYWSPFDSITYALHQA